MDEDFSADVQRLALYAQDEWDFTPRLSIYAGLRWEGLQTDSHGAGFAPVRNRS
eukprot:gene59698-79641_t